MSGPAVYVLRLICGAFLCAIVNSIGGSGAGGGVRRMIAGVFLVLTAMNPQGDLKLPELDFDQIRKEAATAAQWGADQAKEAESAIISEACAAYIWNKADAMGLSVTVQVELDDNSIPCAVTVTGVLTEQERQTLSRILASELGLGEEVQTWNTPHQSGGSQS